VPGRTPRCEPGDRRRPRDRHRTTLTDTGITLEHHGDDIASWAVNRCATGRGHGIRTGADLHFTEPVTGWAARGRASWIK
jgi:hypothetical protein